MRKVSLPELNSKSEPNVVTITNAKIEGVSAGAHALGVATTDEKDGAKIKAGIIFSIPAQVFAYNQYDSLDEFIADCGSTEHALEVVNDLKRDAALNEAKIQIRTTSNKDVDAVIKEAITAAENHSFVETVKLTAKEAKEALEGFKSRAANLSDADLAAELRKLLGM